jgi:phenylalanyl-tRNA synthetase beta chain
VLDVVARNMRHTEERLAFFEIARTYFQRPEDLPYERRALALALSGRREPRSWQTPSSAPYSFYDLKGIVAAVLEELQIADWQVEPHEHPALHPGRSAVLCLDGRDVAFLGELHPDVAAAFDIEGWPVQVAEIDLDTLFSAASPARTFRSLPRYPAALRDIAVVLDADQPSARVMHIVRSAGGDLLESAEIFDVYAGDPLPQGKKSIAISLELRAPGATLTQDEVNEVMDRVTDSLKGELNATLRE